MCIRGLIRKGFHAQGVKAFAGLLQLYFRGFSSCLSSFCPENYLIGYIPQ